MKQKSWLIPAGVFVGSPIRLLLSTISARAELKPSTIYRIWSDTDLYFKFGGSTVAAAITDHPLGAKADAVLATDTVNFFISSVVLAGNGTLSISELAVNPLRLNFV